MAVAENSANKSSLCIHVSGNASIKRIPNNDVIFVVTKVTSARGTHAILAATTRLLWASHIGVISDVPI
jgi:phage repressor protein C with HTH and peptisase S24 domain